MKIGLFCTALLFAANLYSQQLPKGLLVYDVNARNGAAYATSEFFRGLQPHGNSVGIVMFGGGVPPTPDAYNASPHGPLVLSFIRGGHAATVTKMNFWVSNPGERNYQPYPVLICAFDADGTLLSTQWIAQFEFPVTIQRVGPIASVQVGNVEYPKYLMVSDIHFDAPRVIHEKNFQMPNLAQLQRPTRFTDFETYADGMPTMYGSVSNEWQQLGVVFTDEDGAPAHIYQSSGNLLPPRSGTHGITSESGNNLVITFVDPESGDVGTVTEAGIWVSNGGIGGGPTTVRFIDASGSVIETVTSSGKYFFAGARSKRGIAGMVLTDPDYFLADDLQFSHVRRSR